MGTFNSVNIPSNFEELFSFHKSVLISKINHLMPNILLRNTKKHEKNGKFGIYKLSRNFHLICCYISSNETNTTTLFPQ